MIVELNNLIKPIFSLHSYFVITLLFIFSFSAKAIDDYEDISISIIVVNGAVVYKCYDRDMELFDIIRVLVDFRDNVLRDSESMSITIEADEQVPLSSLLYAYNLLSEKITQNIKCRVKGYDLLVKKAIVLQRPRVTALPREATSMQNEEELEETKNISNMFSLNRGITYIIIIIILLGGMFISYKYGESRGRKEGGKDDQEPRWLMGKL